MRLTIPHFLDCKQCKSPPIGGCKLLPVVNEWDDSTGPNMPPIYDLILDQSGKILIRMIDAIDASDAWRQGKQQFPHSILGVVFKENPEMIENKVNKNKKPETT